MVLARFRKPLYKYMSRRFARQLVRHGMLRVGTLSDFRDREKHGVGASIGDHEEGKHSIWTQVDRCADDSTSIPAFAQSIVSLTGKDSFMINCDVISNVTSENMFIFSASKVLDREVMARMKYDTIVKICDPIRFLEVIASALTRESLVHPDVVIGECIYASRHMHYSKMPDCHPALLKGPEYGYQAEVRMIMKPIAEQIEPRDICCPDITAYCRFVSDRESPQS